MPEVENYKELKFRRAAGKVWVRGIRYLKQDVNGEKEVVRMGLNCSRKMVPHFFGKCSTFGRDARQIFAARYTS